MTTPKKIETGHSFQTRRVYRVGTFKHDFGVLAYLRDYHPSWTGCIEYEVLAPSGDLAKKAAIRARKAEPDQGDSDMTEKQLEKKKIDDGGLSHN